MKKYNFFKTDGHRPSQEQLLDTQLFYQNAPEIYVRFDEWKDIDRTTKPFLDYINRAIDFVREEKKEYFSSLDF